MARYKKKKNRIINNGHDLFMAIILGVMIIAIIMNIIIKYKEVFIILFGIIIIIGIFIFIKRVDKQNHIDNDMPIFTKEKEKDCFKKVKTKSQETYREYKNPQKIQEEIYQKQKLKQEQEKYKQNLNNTYTSSYKKPKESNYQKGKNYEEQIGKYYESLGYYVIYHGIKMGKEDKGIDLIAIKEDEALFIQCKNWTTSKIKQKHIKEFMGSCYAFLEKNPNYKNKKTKQIFITSNNEVDYGVKKFIEENYKIIEYKIIPYQNA